MQDPLFTVRLVIDLNIRCKPCPPRGVSDFTAKQVKGTATMPADVIFKGTNDVDPNAVTHTSTVILNNAPVSTITLPVVPGQPFVFNYSATTPISGTLPVLAAGNTAQASDVTTDNQNPALSSPAILTNVVTIQAQQPAPTGVSGFSAAQVGAP